MSDQLDDRISADAALLRLFKNEYRESSDRHNDALFARDYVAALEGNCAALQARAERTERTDVSTNDGGPAFPCAIQTGTKDFVDIEGRSVTPNVPVFQHFPGMTLRDYFAAHAPVHDLSQMIPHHLHDLCRVIGIPLDEYKAEVHYLPFIVALRYRWADAMLAERAKGTK